MPEEIPTSPDTTYLLAPPPAVESDKSGHGGDVDETLAIFCIDVSGSMCVTTEVSLILLDVLEEVLPNLSNISFLIPCGL